MAEPFGRRMRAVCGREGVVDPDIAERRQRIDETGIVLLFASVKPGVFEANDVAVLHCAHCSLGRRADAVVGKSDRAIEDAGERISGGFERILRIAPLGSPKMRQQDHLAAFVGDFRDRRRRPFEPRPIADLAAFHRHVEVHPEQHALALEVGLIKCAKRGHDEIGASDQLAHSDGRVGHAVGEAPLVVVPGHHPHQGAIHDLGLVHVEDR